MKTFYSLLSLTLLTLIALTLQPQHLTASNLNDLPTVTLLNENTVHFLSPQPIKYVDISSQRIKGDLPVENLLRIKLLLDSSETSPTYPKELGTLTIVAEDFISQYRLVHSKQDRKSTRLNSS